MPDPLAYYTANEELRRGDPLEGCPPDIRQLVFETRSLNGDGICGVKGCGRPLKDTIGCAEHALYGVTDSERLESRARRLGIAPTPHHRKFY